jgi:hypothetical protein
MGAHKIIIPLKNGKHFHFVPAKEKGERGLGLEHVITFLRYCPTVLNSRSRQHHIAPFGRCA